MLMSGQSLQIQFEDICCSEHVLGLVDRGVYIHGELS